MVKQKKRIAKQITDIKTGSEGVVVPFDDVVVEAASGDDRETEVILVTEVAEMFRLIKIYEFKVIKCSSRQRCKNYILNHQICLFNEFISLYSSFAF